MRPSMSFFTMSRAIPPCTVTKRLVKQVETEILQIASDLDGEYFSASNLWVTISDATGLEMFHSIDEFRNDVFSSDTVRITLKYNPTVQSNTRLCIAVTLSESSPRSIMPCPSGIDFNLTCDTAKETATGRTQRLFEVIKQAELKHFFNCVRFLDKPIQWSFPILMALSISSLIVLYSNADTAIKRMVGHACAMTALICVSFAVYFLIGATLPFCLFDSPASTRRLDTIRYYTRTYVTALIGVAIIKACISYIPFEWTQFVF